MESKRIRKQIDAPQETGRNNEEMRYHLGRTQIQNAPETRPHNFETKNTWWTCRCHSTWCRLDDIHPVEIAPFLHMVVVGSEHPNLWGYAPCQNPWNRRLMLWADHLQPWCLRDPEKIIKRRSTLGHSWTNSSLFKNPELTKHYTGIKMISLSLNHVFVMSGSRINETLKTFVSDRPAWFFALMTLGHNFRKFGG